jgi:hypothetical protein
LRPIELRENRVSKGKEKNIPVLEVARLLLPSSAAKHIWGSQFATFSFPRLHSISANREKIQWRKQKKKKKKKKIKKLGIWEKEETRDAEQMDSSRSSNETTPCQALASTQ